ncbi:MAG: S8 family serine peptidase [Microthrixaceae bacterium]
MRRAVGALAAVVLVVSTGAAFAQHAPASRTIASAQPAPVQVMAPGLADQLEAAPAGEDVMVFVHATTVSDAKQAATTAGLQVVDQWDRINVAIAVGTPDAVERVSLDPAVSYVEPNRAVDLYLDTAHKATGADDARSEAFNLLDANGNAFDGTGITIAINDTGVDGTHPMFDGGGTTKVVRNLRQVCHQILCDTFVDVPDSDQANGHGTHVAGIAAGYEDTMVNGEIVRGAAPGAKLVGLGSGAGLSLYGTTTGLNWVLDNHADPCGDDSCPPIKVVNNSWGSGGGAFRPNDAASLLSDLLVAEGVTVVFSAGNGDTAGDGGNGSDNRVNSYSQNPTPGVIAVANYDDGGNGSRNNALDSSSSRGLKTDPTTYPDLAAPGTNITSACTYLLPICRSSADVTDPYYAAITGTSMAAPYVSGIVAVLLQADPLLTPADLEDILEDTAHKFGDPADFVADPRNTDDTTAYDRGHGLIDVTRALARALDRPAPGGGPVCGGGAGIVDADGDATDVVFPTGAPSALSENALDVTAASVTTNPSTGALTFSIKVVDLGDLPPKGAIGEYFRYYFTYGGARYLLGMQRLGGSAAGQQSFNLSTDGLSTTSESVATGLPGSFDPTTDTISATLPANVFNAWKPTISVIGDGDLVTGLEILAQRRLTPLTISTDTAAGTCPYIVGT